MIIIEKNMMLINNKTHMLQPGKRTQHENLNDHSVIQIILLQG